MKHKPSENLIEMLRTFERNQTRVYILTKSNLRFLANSLILIDEDTVQFRDKFNNQVLLSIDEISMITENKQ